MFGFVTQRKYDELESRIKELEKFRELYSGVLGTISRLESENTIKVFQQPLTYSLYGHHYEYNNSIISLKECIYKILNKLDIKLEYSPKVPEKKAEVIFKRISDA